MIYLIADSWQRAGRKILRMGWDREDIVVLTKKEDAQGRQVKAGDMIVHDCDNAELADAILRELTVE